MNDDLKSISDAAVSGDITEVMVDKAMENRLLIRLRHAAYYMPDGKKAQKVSIIGKNLYFFIGKKDGV